jgi:hypothetical protein
MDGVGDRTKKKGASILSYSALRFFQPSSHLSQLLLHQKRFHLHALLAAYRLPGLLLPRLLCIRHFRREVCSLCGALPQA